MMKKEEDENEGEFGEHSQRKCIFPCACRFGLLDFVLLAEPPRPTTLGTTTAHSLAQQGTTDSREPPVDINHSSQDPIQSVLTNL